MLLTAHICRRHISTRVINNNRDIWSCMVRTVEKFSKKLSEGVGFLVEECVKSNFLYGFAAVDVPKMNALVLSDSLRMSFI